MAEMMTDEIEQYTGNGVSSGILRVLATRRDIQSVVTKCCRERDEDIFDHDPEGWSGECAGNSGSTTRRSRK